MGYVRVKIYGVNLNKLYKLLNKNNIEIKNIQRLDYKNIVFDIKTSKLKKLFAILKNSCYNISVQDYYGLSKFLHFFKSNVGYLVGIVLFVVTILASNLFVSDIKIYGNSSVESNQIVQLLGKNNITHGTFLANISTQQIENLLTSNFDQISLCSVIKKGTQIIINIKEKQALLSDYNLDSQT